MTAIGFIRDTASTGVGCTLFAIRPGHKSAASVGDSRFKNINLTIWSFALKLSAARFVAQQRGYEVDGLRKTELYLGK
jgi:hypothetical protein